MQGNGIDLFIEVCGAVIVLGIIMAILTASKKRAAKKDQK